MISLSALSEDEYLKICKVIRYDIIVEYFKKNPKEFSKIHPGFRPNAVTSKDAVRLLVAYKEREFISSFVGEITKKWINEILAAVEDYKNDDKYELTAYIHALYQSFFADNISAFFKLIEKEYNDDQLKIISNLVSLLKEIDKKQRELEESSRKAKDALNSSEKNNKKVNQALEKANKRITDLLGCLEKMKSMEKQFREINSAFIVSENKNLEQQKQLEELRRQVSQLNNSIKELQKEKAELEVSIRAKNDEEKEEKVTSVHFSNPLRPIDLTEFQEYLSYNLESVGIKNSPLQINKLLTVYITSIIFQGRPVVCNKSYMSTLVKCISNTLIGSTSIDTIAFSADMNEKKIIKEIIKCGRIVVLDNFIGNVNESLLLSLLDKFKNRIVILTVMYDGTLRHLSKELFEYCNYVNLSSVPTLTSSVEPGEDPSTIEEEEYSFDSIEKENRYQLILKEIMSELGYPKTIISTVSPNIEDDKSMCGYLIFGIIPFSIDVYSKNPINYSETLQRYVERCPYKSIFEEWFLK